MASESELKNLGEALQVTLGRLRDAGVTILISTMNVKNSYQGESSTSSSVQVNFDPMFICEKCPNWSPAARCLWCDDDDEPADPGGHG